MSGQTVGEILSQARQDLLAFGAFCEALRPLVRQERVGMLLTYCHTHIASVEKGMRESEAEISRDVLSTWLRMPEEPGVRRLLEGDTATAPATPATAMTLERLVTLATGYVAALQERFRQGAEAAPNGEVREVFRHLASLMAQAKEHLAFQGAAVKDL
ncbi:MAG: hypothetical protein GX442_09710 [Candidatus Riflebacteria bacterium]|nr:hypothetical protein [Candidatus Riflebacteria bacterium]